MTANPASVHQADPHTHTPRLRLLFIANSVAVGGAETQLVRVAMGCAARGHRVTVMTLLDLPGWQPELRAAGVDLRKLPVRHWSEAPLLVARGWRAVRSLRPDAIIGFDFQASMLARLAGRLAGVPLVVSSIRNEHLGGPMRDAIMRLSEPLATVTTTNSQRVADSLTARGIVRAGRVAVLPNGMDVAAMQRPPGTRQRLRAELGITDEEFVWLSVSHLRPTKDIPTLLRAVADMSRGALPPHRLLIAGSGELRDELRRAGAALGVEGRVTFLGRRDDVPDLLAAVDGFVLASRAEGLPNAVMEALAAKLPVVATSVGGIPELIEDGVHGYLVSPGDPAALTQRLTEVMLMDPQARGALGRAGHHRIASDYATEQLVDRWVDLLVARTRGRTP
jgi:glycosyltransferase involved in cell wall biosynthesis